MDKHDVAHYGIGAILAGGVAALGWSIPSASPSWPVLGEDKARAIAAAASEAVHGQKIAILCISKDCKKIAYELLNGGVREAKDFQVDSVSSAPDGLTVAASTEEDANALKAAVEKASGGTLKVVDAIGPYAETYISFGALPDETGKK